MNLVETLEKGHSKEQSKKIADYVGTNPKRFEALVKVYLHGPYRITQRSAMPLGYCAERHPELIYPHLKHILQLVQKEGVHDAVKRNTLRLLQFIEIPKRLQAQTLSICFSFLTDAKEPVAVKVFAMTVLTNLARKIPELKNELIPIIEEHLPYGSAAFNSRGRKLLKVLRQPY